MSVRNAVLCLLAGISAMVGSRALANIDFGDESECRANYETNCVLFGADNSRRILRIFFDGTTAENSDGIQKCGRRTKRLKQEIDTAMIALNLPLEDVQIERITYSQPGTMRPGVAGRSDEYRCSYVIKTKRLDLRFSAHKFNRRFFTSPEEQNGVCMDDVRAAQSIPNSIGATRWMTFAAAQGEMCNTHYAQLGVDRVEKDADGNSRLIKFGADSNSAP